jgi:hypothetical protein
MWCQKNHFVVCEERPPFGHENVVKMQRGDDQNDSRVQVFRTATAKKMPLSLILASIPDSAQQNM